MERKFISIDALKKVLSPKEMKNVMGGSAFCCYCFGGSTLGWIFEPTSTPDLIERIEAECGDFGGHCDQIEKK